MQNFGTAANIYDSTRVLATAKATGEIFHHYIKKVQSTQWAHQVIKTIQPMPMPQPVTDF